MYQKLEERLAAAKSVMEVSSAYWVRDETWSEIIDRHYNQCPVNFFGRVDAAKELLIGWGDPLPLKKIQQATGLRLAIEDVVYGYFGKAHLAVALAELEFRVVFDTPNHFSSNFRSRMTAKRIKKAWGNGEPKVQFAECEVGNCHGICETSKRRTLGAVVI